MKRRSRANWFGKSNRACVSCSTFGLNYLTLHRGAATLSGGEAQRIRLAAQLGSGLCGVLYVLDEPTIGLHPRDNLRLLAALHRLRDLGNTLLVVEHDRDVIAGSDYLCDFGPRAGRHGGRIVAEGSPKTIAPLDRSVTAGYITGSKQIPIPQGRRPVLTEGGKPLVEYLSLIGASEHNLEDVDLKVPLGVLTVVTGPSGKWKEYADRRNVVSYSGQAAASIEDEAGTTRKGRRSSSHRQSDSPSIRHRSETHRAATPRRTPVCSMRSEICSHPFPKRQKGDSPRGHSVSTLPAEDVKLAKAADNAKSRCTSCPTCGCSAKSAAANATTKTSWRSSTTVSRSRMCWTCLAVKPLSCLLRNLESFVFCRRCAMSGSTMSRWGSPRQLCRAVRPNGSSWHRSSPRPGTGRTLYLLDEPTTGLHFDDIAKLLDVIQRLVDLGNTCVVIEHNLDVIKCADWVIDMGPGAGIDGGRIVFEGTPEQLAATAGGRRGKASAVVSETAGFVAEALGHRSELRSPGQRKQARGKAPAGKAPGAVRIDSPAPGPEKTPAKRNVDAKGDQSVTKSETPKRSAKRTAGKSKDASSIWKALGRKWHSMPKGFDGNATPEWPIKLPDRLFDQIEKIGGEDCLRMSAADRVDVVGESGDVKLSIRTRDLDAVKIIAKANVEPSEASDLG